ncbi:hypothetical protein Fmac_003058 [Flemingia macrophylla]|uniref:Uncharacterized protein n=1 Tax=Flemingia macrophylla TaxID=520843 RepID=A0ABD1NMG9_9FABA
MDPSQDLALDGEFNGTESGWTTYIGSRIYNEVSNGDDEHSADIEDCGNNYKNDDDDNKGENNDDFNRDTDEESDDSMASDAASVPSHLQLVCINSERHGLDFTEHTENDNEKTPLTKKKNKQVRKTRYEGIVEKEEDSLLVADSAASHV